MPKYNPLNPLTVGRKWKLRRNLVIAAAHLKCGFSQRFLADVFDLPRSRIASIVKQVQEAAGQTPEPGPGPCGPKPLYPYHRKGTTPR